MKNKLSRFAVPYEVWMAIFVVAPIVIMVVYAFSSADGGFTLDNFVQMGGYTEVFLRSFKLAIIATMICLIIGYPVSYLMSREGASVQWSILHKERASGGLLFPAAGKVGKRAARHRWFLDFLCLQEFHSIGDVRGIDSATDPLPLPL